MRGILAITSFFLVTGGFAAEIHVDKQTAEAVVGTTAFGFDLASGGSIISLRRGDREFVKPDG